MSRKANPETNETQARPQAQPAYTKAQILKSNRFTAIQRHILHAALAEDGLYSLEEAAETINQIMKREVR
ncbi:hypothetical protein [Paenibacillus glycinis]|uniref:Uncharacterized protein n=1 Tax=Paenibacillus glycinis TaxID=2697035 RepID=A0ABW9XNY0_9BACL|nr:hypothetical protein [Paenibacillus glycinis]NBD24324.1 hypothetical protein [Paenibacillus glycinis]